MATESPQSLPCTSKAKPKATAKVKMKRTARRGVAVSHPALRFLNNKIIMMMMMVMIADTECFPCANTVLSTLHGLSNLTPSPNSTLLLFLFLMAELQEK